MANPYLTRNAGIWVFQIRLPRSLDPDSFLAPIRVSLGALPKRQARDLALGLAAAAKLHFARIGGDDRPEAILDEDKNLVG